MTVPSAKRSLRGTGEGMNFQPRPKYYRVIYADPPWTFATYSRKGKGRSAEAHYDCMSLADIKRFALDLA